MTTKRYSPIKKLRGYILKGFLCTQQGQHPWCHCKIFRVYRMGK